MWCKMATDTGKRRLTILASFATLAIVLALLAVLIAILARR